MRVVVLMSLCFASVAAADSFPTKEELEAARRLDPTTVSAEAHKFLKAKMKSHAKSMKDLSIAVATLNFEVTQRSAQEMANQPRLDASTGAAAKLPKGFFAMQDLLRRAAQGLADSAAAGKVDATVDQFQYVVTICAACHGAMRGAAKPPAVPAQ